VQVIGNVAVIYRRNVKSDRFGKVTSSTPQR
jgi:RNA-binding protein YhbY